MAGSSLMDANLEGWEDFVSVFLNQLGMPN